MDLSLTYREKKTSRVVVTSRSTDDGAWCTVVVAHDRTGEIEQKITKNARRQYTRDSNRVPFRVSESSP